MTDIARHDFSSVTGGIVDIHCDAHRHGTLDCHEFDDLPVVATGGRLADFEVYLDLNNLAHGPFRALEGQTAGSGHRFVAELEVDPAIWNRLVRKAADVSLAESGAPLLEAAS